MHWTPPIYLNDANFCTVAYQAKNNPAEIRIPVSKDQRLYVIGGLNRDTLYQVRLFCFYGGAIGPSTKWFKAATRTGRRDYSRGRTCVTTIGVGRFRILGGARFRILGGQGGANSQQAHDVVMTSMRRNDVASTSFRRHVPTRF